MNINQIKVSFNKEQLVLNCLIAFVFIYTFKILFWMNIYVSFLLICMPLFLILINRNLKKSVLVWLSISILLLYFLFKYYYTCANHHFVLCYLVLTLVIATLYNDNYDKILKYNSQFLLVVIYFFAGFNKLITAEFTNGALLSYLTMEGGLFKPLHIFDSYDAFVKTNTELLKTVNNTNPNELNPIVLQMPFKVFPALMLVLTWFTIIGELLAALFFLFFSNKHFTHIFNLLFLFGLLFIRHETGFISILSIMGLITVKSDYKICMLGYLCLFVICMGLMFTRYGAI